MASEMQINLGQLAALAEEVSKTKREQTVVVRADVIAVLKPVRGKSTRREFQPSWLRVPTPLPDQDELDRFIRQERAIRAADGGIVSATAGVLRSLAPAKSAEKLRALAEEAIADERTVRHS